MHPDAPDGSVLAALEQPDVLRLPFGAWVSANATGQFGVGREQGRFNFCAVKCRSRQPGSTIVQGWRNAAGAALGTQGLHPHTNRSVPTDAPRLVMPRMMQGSEWPTFAGISLDPGDYPAWLRRDTLAQRRSVSLGVRALSECG